MIDLFISAFVTLFVVIDPPGCAPIYASLTVGADARQRRSMAVRATLIAGAILLFFALFGESLLSALHIDLDSFRIAGGIMLFIIAIDMVFEKRTERREKRAGDLMGTPEGDKEDERYKGLEAAVVGEAVDVVVDMIGASSPQTAQTK